MTSSPVLYAGQLCLSFWYNMPTDASALNVYKESGSRRSLLWSKSHVTSGGWQRETIILSANETFQVSIIVFIYIFAGSGKVSIDIMSLYMNENTATIQHFISPMNTCNSKYQIRLMNNF